MNYLIFSDESGRWNEGEYYLRSWIKISPRSYITLRKEIIFIKHETSIEELKWGSFISNLNNIEDSIKLIQNIDFSIFITLSMPTHFKNNCKNKKYKILTTLQEITPEKSTGKIKVTRAIKERITSAAQHAIFLSLFESQHIENAKNALVRNLSPDSYELIVDKPQCLYKDWEITAREHGITNVKIEGKSETEPGIELADIVAGCIHGCLKGNEQAKDCYQKYFKSKMLDMYSTRIPNPNWIFFEDFTVEQKSKINIFR